MASTIHVWAPTGLTLKVELFPDGSDTIANVGGDDLTEESNRKGLYTASIATITGKHTAHVKLGTTVIAGGYVNLQDGQVCLIVEGTVDTPGTTELLVEVNKIPREGYKYKGTNVTPDGEFEGEFEIHKITDIEEVT